MSISW